MFSQAFLKSAVLILLLFPFAALAQEQDSKSASDSQSEKEVSPETKALHAKLAKYLSGTKWTGQFSMTGQTETKTEYYEILSAEKGEMGDYWNLVARIKYGGKDKTIPLPPIEIKFADKTPVITVDQAFFPGFGKFDARVLIRQGKYAGTWAHSGGAGGHLFGTIERMDDDEVKKKSDDVKKNMAKEKEEAKK
jgi:hypothetical protein